MKRRSGGNHPRPGLPKVNLLSRSDLDRISVRRLRNRFVAGGVALVLLVGAGWFVQHQRVNDAEKLVTIEKAQTDKLSGQAQELTAIKTFVAGVDGQKQVVATTMAKEIYFSRVLSGIRGASPTGTTLQSITVTLAPDAASASTAGGNATGASVCPGPDPFQTETIVGCVTLSGTAVSRAEVGDLVTRLADDNLFIEPFVSTTTTGDGETVTFSGSVGLSAKVYSGRYGDVPAPPARTPAGAAPDDTADQAAAATGGAS
jgi:hypothetical protein